MVYHFLLKSSKFCIFRTMRFCSNFTSMWSKYFSNNVRRDFRPSVSNGNLKWPDRGSIFAVILPLKLFRATVANANPESLKSRHTLLDTYLDYMLEKFESNRLPRNLHNIIFLDKKSSSFKTIFDKALTPLFLWLKQLFDG